MTFLSVFQVKSFSAKKEDFVQVFQSETVCLLYIFKAWHSLSPMSFTCLWGVGLAGGGPNHCEVDERGTLS